jgi:hypothetical protein
MLWLDFGWKAGFWLLSSPRGWVETRFSYAVNRFFPNKRHTDVQSTFFVANKGP